MYSPGRPIRACVLIASVGLACGEGSGSSTGSTGSQGTSGDTDPGGTSGASNAEVTGNTEPTGTAGASSSSSSGGDSGVYAGYFRLQSFGMQIQLLGNFLESFTPGGETTVGLCAKQGISTGFISVGGSMTVLRGDEVLLVAEPLPSAMIAPVTLATGDQLMFEGVAPDGLLSDFTVGPLVVPSFPTDIVEPESIIIGESVTISWTAPADAIGDVLVELVQSQAGLNKIQCVVPVSDGSVTIDASLLTHLVPTDADNPIVQMGVSPFDELLAVVDGKTVEVEFLAALAAFGAPAIAN